MWGPSARTIGACVSLSLIAAAALAQSELPTRQSAALGLPKALSRAIERNPELVAFGYQIAAAEGALRQARLAPNPELSAAVEDALGSGMRRGFDDTETTVTLGWVLERGVRQRMIDAADASVSLTHFDAEIMRLDVAAETARRFLACLAYQSRLESAAAAVAAAQETVALVRQRVAAGGALEAELARAEADLVRTELGQEDYEHELLSAYRRLAAQWGETTPDFGSVRGDVETLPPEEPFETLLARVEGNPELARFMSERRLDEAELALAEARRRPNWNVYAGLRRYENTDDFALVGGITVPLTLRDKNQGRIATARANVARTEAEQTATRVRVETELFVLYQELRHNQQFASRLRADVIPRIETALEDTRRAYELGRYGYSEWRSVQTELLDTRSELLEASIDAHRIVIEIERLTGVRAAPAAAQ